MCVFTVYQLLFGGQNSRYLFMTLLNTKSLVGCDIGSYGEPHMSKPRASSLTLLIVPRPDGLFIVSVCIPQKAGYTSGDEPARTYKMTAAVGSELGTQCRWAEVSGQV